MNSSNLYHIQKEINNLTRGILDITGYYTKIMKFWEKLSTTSSKIQCNCLCTCGAKVNMHKDERDRHLIQFLMGLNELYTVVRGNILMVNPLPFVVQVFSLKMKNREK